MEVPLSAPTIILTPTQIDPIRRHSVGKKRKADTNDVERDKNGKIVKFCREEGCTFKTGDSTYMKRHQVSVHGFDFSCAGDGDKVSNNCLLRMRP